MPSKEKLKQTAMKLLKQIIREWNKFEEHKDARHLQTLETLREKSRAGWEKRKQSWQTVEPPPEPFESKEGRAIRRFAREARMRQAKALQAIVEAAKETVTRPEPTQPKPIHPPQGKPKPKPGKETQDGLDPYI